VADFVQERADQTGATHAWLRPCCRGDLVSNCLTVARTPSLVAVEPESTSNAPSAPTDTAILLEPATIVDIAAQATRGLSVRRIKPCGAAPNQRGDDDESFFSFPFSLMASISIDTL
jgi:hypothetical protein